MAKNRTMAILNAKAKKAAMREALDNQKTYMSTLTLSKQDRPSSVAMNLHYKPYSVTPKRNIAVSA